MNTQQHNLFIIDDNTSNSMPLMKFLKAKFGDSLQITSYQSGEFALSKIDKETHIVILDKQMQAKAESDLIQSIKKINPKTEVIVLSTNEDIAEAIQSYRKGVIDVVIKDRNTFQKTASVIYKILLYPIRILVEEFRVSKFVAIFFLTFLIVGLIVYIILGSSE